MNSVRIGLIGLGIHGIRYARHLAAGEVKGARLEMVCRRDRTRGESEARELGVRFTADYRSILSSPDVDAVALVVPCHLHPSLVPETLEAGKPILVEKPLAPEAEAARPMVEAALRSSLPAMVAQTLRFNSLVRALRERAGELGTLRFLSFSQSFEPSERPWLDETVGGGILRNTGVHSFDLLRHLSGREVEEVSCFSQRLVTRRTEDAFAAVLKLSDGILASVDNQRTTASRSGRIEWVAEGGHLVGDHVHHTLREIRGSSIRELELPPPLPTVRECLAAFVSAVRGEAPVPVPLEEGLRAIEIVDACRASAAEGTPRRVDRRNE